MSYRRKNGTGGITKMPGKRNNPYRVRITKGWLLDMVEGKSKQQIVTLGKKDIFNCIVERMKQQDSEQASDHDMPEDDKERMPEKYETVSLDDFVKYNIMKENIDFYFEFV